MSVSICNILLACMVGPIEGFVIAKPSRSMNKARCFVTPVCVGIACAH